MATTGDEPQISLVTKLDVLPEAASTDGSNAFQRAVATWRNVDLTSLQKNLDNTASDIVNSQRDSLVERKELAQKTKEFRKMDEEGRASEWKGLLKSYQLFIDHLTTQKKATETSFLAIYSALSEAPDPYPLLEATIDNLVSSEDVTRLTSENSALRITISRQASQVSHLETRLEEQKREQEKKDKERVEEVSKAEGVLRVVLDEKTRNWEAKEKSFLEKISDLEGLIREVKASYEVAQRMGRHGDFPTNDGKEGKEDHVGSNLAELEIVSRDLERTNLRLAEVEARNEQLRLELANATVPSADGSQATKESQQADDEDDDPQMLRLQNENWALMKKLDLAKEQVEDDKREWDRKIKTLERSLEEVKGDKAMLKAKLDRWGDYEEVKRELEILKSIEFSTGDEDEDDEMLDFSKSQPDTRTKDTSGGKETLEQLLLARNKKLSNELTVSRVSHQDLTSRLQALQKTLESTSAELNQARQLNARLEDDLYKLQSEIHTTPFSSAMSMAGTRFAPSMSHGRGGRVSPTSSIISGFSPVVGGRGDTLASLRGEPAPAGEGILPMITAQRDRFKQRNSQLEDELAKANSTISSLRQEIATLQKDNLQLYEKTRYISSYSHSRPSADSYVTIGATPGGTTSSSFSQAGTGMHDRYRAAYEANISPFQAFRGRETARAMRRMSIVERAMLGFAKVVLANRLSRNLFAGYCVFLHVLVFTMVYWSGSCGANIPGGEGSPLGATEAASGSGWVKEDLSVR
ncbi:CASP C terminal-domain-containing protein [Tirmania nivea]|nr:CASP C terminal-domain-containing protein [Tirmania nivea]